MSRIVLYTYSSKGTKPVSIKNPYKNVDVFYISEKETIGELNGWTVLNCRNALEEKGKEEFERIVFEDPFKIFKTYDYAIYVDPNTVFKHSPLNALKSFRNGGELKLVKPNVIYFKNGKRVKNDNVHSKKSEKNESFEYKYGKYVSYILNERGE